MDVGGCADNCRDDKLRKFHELIEFKSARLLLLHAFVDVSDDVADDDENGDDSDDGDLLLKGLERMEATFIVLECARVRIGALPRV